MRVAIDAARPTSRERPARLFLMASMRDGDQGGLAAPAPPAAALVAAVQVLPPWLWLVVEPGRAMLPAGPWPDLAAAWQLAGNCNVGLRGVTPVGCQKSIVPVTSGSGLTSGYDASLARLPLRGACGLVICLPGVGPRP